MGKQAKRKAAKKRHRESETVDQSDGSEIHHQYTDTLRSRLPPGIALKDVSRCVAQKWARATSGSSRRVGPATMAHITPTQAIVYALWFKDLVYSFHPQTTVAHVCWFHAADQGRGWAMFRCKPMKSCDRDVVGVLFLGDDYWEIPSGEISGGFAGTARHVQDTLDVGGKQECRVCYDTWDDVVAKGARDGCGQFLMCTVCTAKVCPSCFERVYTSCPVCREHMAPGLW